MDWYNRFEVIRKSLKPILGSIACVLILSVFLRLLNTLGHESLIQGTNHETEKCN